MKERRERKRRRGGGKEEGKKEGRKGSAEVRKSQEAGREGEGKNETT